MVVNRSADRAEAYRDWGGSTLRSVRAFGGRKRAPFWLPRSAKGKHCERVQGAERHSLVGGTLNHGFESAATIGQFQETWDPESHECHWKRGTSDGWGGVVMPRPPTPQQAVTHKWRTGKWGATACEGPWDPMQRPSCLGSLAKLAFAAGIGAVIRGLQLDSGVGGMDAAPHASSHEEHEACTNIHKS